MSAFMVNTNVMTKVVTAILLNLDTFDGESTCRTAFLSVPTETQKAVGTRAHGAWRKVETATAARDVPAGESWVFPEDRTMSQVIAEEAA